MVDTGQLADPLPGGATSGTACVGHAETPGATPQPEGRSWAEVTLSGGSPHPEASVQGCKGPATSFNWDYLKGHWLRPPLSSHHSQLLCPVPCPKGAAHQPCTLLSPSVPGGPAQARVTERGRGQGVWAPLALTLLPFLGTFFPPSEGDPTRPPVSATRPSEDRRRLPKTAWQNKGTLSNLIFCKESEHGSSFSLQSQIRKRPAFLNKPEATWPWFTRMMRTGPSRIISPQETHFSAFT